MPYEPIPLATVQECLERSGYLLESQLVSALNGRGFFVEPNQVIRDPRTGKSREIDLIVEFYQYNPEHRKVAVKTHFVVEVINNKFPLVLLTQRPSSPNENFESYVKFACTPEPNPFYHHFDIYEERSPERNKHFSQYCALTLKKGGIREFMASHPEDVYGSLQKLAEYTDDQLASWADRDDLETDTVWRMFFWHPMLVLGGQLVVVVTNEDGTPKLQEADSSFLEFNWHAGEEKRTTLVEVVTVDAFFDRLNSITESDAKMEERLHQLRSQVVPAKGGT